MGWYFNLLVPKKDANLFYKVRMGPMPSAGYGTQLREKEPANKMFKEMKIPLRMDWRLINEFKNLKDFKKYLAKVERRNVDIVACFSYGKLYNTAYLGGHTTVVDKIYISKNKIRLIDPDQDVAKWNTVSMLKLVSENFHIKRENEEKSKNYCSGCIRWMGPNSYRSYSLVSRSKKTR